jgi:hypothetical protein
MLGYFEETNDARIIGFIVGDKWGLVGLDLADYHAVFDAGSGLFVVVEIDFRRFSDVQQGLSLFLVEVVQCRAD